MPRGQDDYEYGLLDAVFPLEHSPQMPTQVWVDQAKALGLCERMTECPNALQAGTAKFCEADVAVGIYADALCGGTGRVPLLDPEKVQYTGPHAICVGAKGCRCNWTRASDCQGRGWIPSTDPQVYVQAAWQRTDLPVAVCASIMAAVKMALDHGEDFVLAAFDVVYDALVGKEKP